MALLVRVAALTPLNSRDHGRCNAQRIMGSQTLMLQQLRCTSLSTPASIFVDRVASSSSWVRANADAVPSTSQVLREKFTSTRNRGRRNFVLKKFQGFGLGSGLYSGVRISNKWKSRPMEGRHHRSVGIARASMKLDPGGGGPGENGIGRVVVNLAIAGGLTYLTITGKLALFTMKEGEEQFCPYCSQPFKLNGKQFVRDGPRFSKKQSKGFREPFGQSGFGGPFGGSGQRQTSAPSSPLDPPGVIVDVEAEVMDQD